ncbi:MAG: hypothetical protein AAGM38_16680 [Pseudomonadota bacterium]
MSMMMRIRRRRDPVAIWTIALSLLLALCLKGAALSAPVAHSSEATIVLCTGSTLVTVIEDADGERRLIIEACEDAPPEAFAASLPASALAIPSISAARAAAVPPPPPPASAPRRAHPARAPPSPRA